MAAMSILASTTAVDLSRLPAPDLIETLDAELILAEMVAQLQAIAPEFTGLVESDPAMKVLQICAFRELLIRQRVNEAAKGCMVAFARGGALDHLGALFGVVRLELAPAEVETGVAAVMEADDDYRRRIVLGPEGFSVAGPASAYIYHALSADPDVLDVSVVSPDPGEVLITVLSRNSPGTAPPELVATVEAAVSAYDVRPMTDQVTVQSATIVDFTVEAVLEVSPGPDSSVVLTKALSNLAVYAERAHRLGIGVSLSGLYAALHVEGVVRVNLATPSADIECDEHQAARLTSWDVTLG